MLQSLHAIEHPKCRASHRVGQADGARTLAEPNFGKIVYARPQRWCFNPAWLEEHELESKYTIVPVDLPTTFEDVHKLAWYTAHPTSQLDSIKEEAVEDEEDDTTPLAQLVGSGVKRPIVIDDEESGGGTSSAPVLSASASLSRSRSRSSSPDKRGALHSALAAGAPSASRASGEPDSDLAFKRRRIFGSVVTPRTLAEVDVFCHAPTAR
jgi:hypothetical protein